MTKMITLFGREPSELRFNDLKRERRCQTWLLTRIKMLLKQEYKSQEKFDSQIRQDKVAFLEMYKQHLEALIQECDFWLDRRAEPLSNSNGRRHKSVIWGENAKRRKRVIADNAVRTRFNATKDEFNVSWDRDTFFLIATDRGYQTEEAVVSMVGKELRLDRLKAKLSLEDGKFTWGQVLVLGAFMEMTPKEFCDTFLAGYFVEAFGEYRADYEHINKEALLKRARKENPLFDIPKVEIEVGADGAPIDEEEWFDE